MEGPIDIDLDALPDSDRFGFWHDCGSLIYRPTPPDRHREHALRVRSRLIQLGDVVLGRMKASAQQYERTNRMTRRDQVDSLHLILVEAGEIHWEFDHQSLHLGTGDLVLLDSSHSSQADWSAHKIIFANFPRELLAPLTRGSHQAEYGILRSEHPYSKVLNQHLHSLWDCQMSGTSGPCAGLGIGLATLVQTYFQGSRQQTDMLSGSQTERSRDVLIPAMQRWIRNELHCADLSAEMIGQAFYLSRSRVYELFKPMGGVRHYIQSLRLEVALTLLQSTAGTNVSISRLAGQLGFSSVSSFSRAFRDKWGLSPKEARAQAAEQVAITPMGSRERLPAYQTMQEQCASYYATFKRNGRHKRSTELAL